MWVHVCVLIHKICHSAPLSSFFFVYVEKYQPYSSFSLFSCNVYKYPGVELRLEAVCEREVCALRDTKEPVEPRVRAEGAPQQIGIHAVGQFLLGVANEL